MTVVPPRAQKQALTTTLHGRTREDPYHWLKDENWQEVLKAPNEIDPAVMAYLKAENNYIDQMLAEKESLRQDLFGEMYGRLKKEDVGIPRKDGAYEYFYRYKENQQYLLYYRRLIHQPDSEQLLIDINELAQGHSFCKVAIGRHSPNHRFLAYTVDFQGAERFELRIRDLTTGKDLPEIITGAGKDFAWANDSATLYFVHLDKSNRTRWVRRYQIGRSLDTIETLYEEANPEYSLHIGKTESRAFITLKSNNYTTTEWYVLDANKPAATFTCIKEREENFQYQLTHNGDYFYLLVNASAAKDGKIYITSVATPQQQYWQTYLPYESGRFLASIRMFKNYFVRLEIKEALPTIVVTQLDRRIEHSIDFDEAAYYLKLDRGFEFDTPVLRFFYSSMVTPERIYDYDMQERRKKLQKEQELPSGYNADDFEMERLFCKGRDGTPIPVTIVRHKQTPRHNAPLFLHGYGAYGLSSPASFSSNRLSLLIRGINVGIAHIRGGKEKGYNWYESAKLMQKKRTFEDYIDCVDELIAKRYTAKGRIIAHGASAGGMVMGVIANMRPELFAGIVADVPFVDVLNTMCDKDLPLTPSEWPEWGNPLESAEAYDYIASYSPYDNVKAQNYPHLLVLAGLTDPRVTYWEPAKWVARLRELKQDSNLLLFHTDMDAGHSGASGRYEILRKFALIYTFAIEVLKKTAPKG